MVFHKKILFISDKKDPVWAGECFHSLRRHYPDQVKGFLSISARQHMMCLKHPLDAANNTGYSPI